MNSSYDGTTIAPNDYQSHQQNLLYKRLKQQQSQVERKQTSSLFKNHSTFQQQSNTRQQSQGGILRRKNFRKNDFLTATDLPENVCLFLKFFKLY